MGSEMCIRDRFVTDGTPEGTSFIFDFQDGISPSNFQGSVTFNGEAYFKASARGSNHNYYHCVGNLLWKTDGTEEGTVIVRGCDENEDGGNNIFLPMVNELFTIVGDTLFFRANSYSELIDDDIEVLWRTDGIPNGSGTYPVVPRPYNETCDLYVGDGNGPFVLNSKLYIGMSERCEQGTDNDYYNGNELRVYDPTNITFGTPLQYTFDFKLQVLEQLYPIYPSEDSADLAIDEPMVNITFQYDLKSAGTLVNQNIALAARSTCAIVENGTVACWGGGTLYTCLLYTSPSPRDS